MHYLSYLFKKRGAPSVNSLNFLSKSNRYWTAFETLAEVERVTAKNDNSSLHVRLER